MHHGTFTPTTFSMEYSFLTSCGSMALFLGQPRHHKTSLRLLLECINANSCFAVTVLKVGIYQSLLKHSVATTFNFFCDIFVESRDPMHSMPNVFYVQHRGPHTQNSLD